MKLVNLCLLLLLLGPLRALGHGDLHLQIEEITRVIEKDPTNAELYLKRGELHRAHQDWDPAQADYDRVMWLDPKMTSVDLARGKMFLEANWLLSANIALDRFLSHYTNNVDGLVTRARTLVKLGKRLDAVQDYTHAINVALTLQPEMFLERSQAWTNEGSAYLEQALKGLDEGIKKLGPLVVLQLCAMDVDLQRKNFDAALTRLDTLAAQSPRKETYLERRGDILQQAGRPQEAREAYQSALAAMASLPPSRRQVPAMMELEKRIRLALDSAPGTGPERK